MTQLSPQEFAQDFGSRFRRSAFRLELLDYYVADNEREPFRQFLAGLPHDPAWRESWKRFVRKAVADGKAMSRVHVVTEPLSDYLRFELTRAYPANVAAGEDIRILRYQDWPRLPPLPSQDFWLLDNKTAAVMTYDGDGNWLAVDLITEPRLVLGCQQARDTAKRHAVPLHGYLATLGMKEAV